MANAIRLDSRKLLGKTRGGTKMTGGKPAGTKPETLSANPIRLDDSKLLGKTGSGTKMTGGKPQGLKPTGLKLAGLKPSAPGSRG